MNTNKIVKTILTKRIDRFIKCIPNDWNDGYNTLMSRFLNLLFNYMDKYQQEKSGIINLFKLKFIYELKGEKVVNWSESISRAIEYIENNLTNDITIEDISNKF